MFHHFVILISNTIGHWGYPGIVVLMTLESSFFPFPSEVVIPPAAYLAATGKMNFAMVVLSGTLGSLLGAIFNYWLAKKYGRSFIEQYGRFLFIHTESLEKAEQFFARHGHVSMFIGRLLPVIRQYISLPAGLARMNFPTFCAATTLGASIWVLVLAGLGYWFGRNEQLVQQHLSWTTLFLVAGCGAILIIYMVRMKRRHKNNIL